VPTLQKLTPNLWFETEAEEAAAFYISIFPNIVNCETQKEVDYYWAKLGEDGDPEAQMCGWLKDKFGLSWQVVPTEPTALLLDEDREKSERAMRAKLQMKKLDLEALRRAHEGR
jgi:predicted 3-demethylubiquinone-9 3-methyltransferase (glyoxalase superfamily)